jgi:hypothetical protein
MVWESSMTAKPYWHCVNKCPNGSHPAYGGQHPVLQVTPAVDLVECPASPAEVLDLDAVPPNLASSAADVSDLPLARRLEHDGEP